MKKYGIRPCELGLLVLFSWKSWQMAAKTAWSAKLIYIKCVDTDKHGQIKQCVEPWWLAILCQLYYYSCADWFPTRITLCSRKPMQTHYTEMAFTVSSLHRGSTPFFASDPSYKKHVEEEKDLFLNCFFFFLNSHFYSYGISSWISQASVACTPAWRWREISL